VCLIIEQNQERPVAVVQPQPPPPIIIPEDEDDNNTDDDDGGGADDDMNYDDSDIDDNTMETIAILHIIDNLQNALTNAQTQLDQLRDYVVNQQ